MPIGWSLLVWLIIILVTYVLCRKFYILPWDSLVLSVLFGYVFLLIFAPFGSVYDRTNPWLIMYILVVVTSPFILAVYIIQNAIKHKSSTNGVFKI